MTQSFGHYDVLGLVGTGGDGDVYRARDTKAGRTVAVRVLSGEWKDALDRTRIIDAIRPFTSVSHPNVATLFEVGHQDGRVYLVYEFVPGDKLSSLCAGHPMNIRRALDLAAQIADALAEAHAAGVVHGALIPSGVSVTTKGRAKVLDFGLAAWQREDGVEIDARTDIAALGALLYQMVTGRPASAEGGPSGQAAEPSVAPSVINNALTVDLDRIVMKALAPDPADRFQSAAEMAAELRSASERQHAIEAVLEYRPSPEPQPSRWPRRVVFGALVCAATALAFWHWQGDLRQVWREWFGPKVPPQIVVVPFSIGGGDTSRPYFGAALAEDLARRVTDLPGVTLQARGSIRLYAGKSAQEAAQAAHATAVLGGTVTPGDPEWKRVALKITLADGSTGKTVWSHQYETALADVVSVEARVARDLADYLKIAFAPNDTQRRASLRVVDPQAFDLCLQAREALAGQDASRAVQLFESALAADASLVEARTGLVEALYSGATFEGRMALVDAFPRMRAVSEEAATADPDAAAVRLALGLSAPTIPDALASLRAAVDADVSSPAAYLAMAGLIREIDPARAARLQQRVIELDPTLPAVRYQLAATYLSMGQFDQALVETARGRAMQPGWPWWDALRIRVRLAQPGPPAPGATPGRTPAADAPPRVVMQAAELVAARKFAAAGTLLEGMTRLYPSACDAWVMLAGVRALEGDRSESGRLANAMMAQADAAEDKAPWARCAASMAAAVGDHERASRWIRRAASTPESLRLWVAANSLIQPTAAIRQKIYPWKNVADSPDVIAALSVLDASMARARGEAARALAGFLEPSPPQ